ncbi:MAG TPA: hypothetical protein VD928_00790 [Candidatus Paceibacterota bacterium]|nr:hypothetical protein [Candidatus Paceibacterota bacterium]
MVSSGSTFKDLVLYLISILDLIVPFLAALALALFMWSGVRYIYKARDSKGLAAERTAIVWGLVALFVLFSIWGILEMLERTFL